MYLGASVGLVRVNEDNLTLNVGKSDVFSIHTGKTTQRVQQSTSNYRKREILLSPHIGLREGLAITARGDEASLVVVFPERRRTVENM